MLTPAQKEIQINAYNFAKKELAPYAMIWDAKCTFPRSALQRAASLGYTSIYCNKSHRGMGLGRLEASLIFEGLATGCVASASYLAIHNMCSWIIDTYGNEDQKKKFLPRLYSLNSNVSFCLTEPLAGSDATALKTVAKEDGDYFIINGSKALVSGDSDILIIFCITDEKKEEISALIIEKEPNLGNGLTIGKTERQLGWNIQPTRLVQFKNLRISKANLIGYKGEGFKIATSALLGGRINISSCSLGGAAFCLNQVKEYTQNRKQFGKKISSFQNTQFKFAELAANLHGCRLITRFAASSIDTQNPDTLTYSAMTKLFVPERCFNIANETLQLLGGYGVLREYQVERVFRELRMHMIAGGTVEVMKMLVARNTLIH